jgi:hypothetical protein
MHFNIIIFLDVSFLLNFTPKSYRPKQEVGWGLRAGPDDMEKLKFLTLPGLELRSLGLPARR